MNLGAEGVLPCKAQMSMLVLLSQVCILKVTQRVCEQLCNVP